MVPADLRLGQRSGKLRFASFQHIVGKGKTSKGLRFLPGRSGHERLEQRPNGGQILPEIILRYLSFPGFCRQYPDILPEIRLDSLEKTVSGGRGGAVNRDIDGSLPTVPQGHTVRRRKNRFKQTVVEKDLFSQTVLRPEVTAVVISPVNVGGAS